MGCPGGCIGGGGSPMPTNTEIRKQRMKAIYAEDEALAIRASHDNPIVKQLYEEYLGEPLGRKIARSAAYQLYQTRELGVHLPASVPKR